MVAQPVPAGFDDQRQITDATTADSDCDIAPRHRQILRCQLLMHCVCRICQRPRDQLLMDFVEFHKAIDCVGFPKGVDGKFYAAGRLKTT
jgi:hypothetical protein